MPKVTSSKEEANSVGKTKREADKKKEVEKKRREAKSGSSKAVDKPDEQALRYVSRPILPHADLDRIVYPQSPLNLR